MENCPELLTQTRDIVLMLNDMLLSVKDDVREKKEITKGLSARLKNKTGKNERRHHKNKNTHWSEIYKKGKSLKVWGKIW